MDVIASQITSLTIVYSTVYSKKIQIYFYVFLKQICMKRMGLQAVNLEQTAYHFFYLAAFTWRVSAMQVCKKLSGLRVGPMNLALCIVKMP